MEWKKFTLRNVHNSMSRHIKIHKASFEISICRLFQLQALQMFRKIDFNGICDGQIAKVAVDRKCIANANWAMIPFYYSLATSQPRASCSGFVSFKLHKRPNWILMQKSQFFDARIWSLSVRCGRKIDTVGKNFRVDRYQYQVTRSCLTQCIIQSSNDFYRSEVLRHFTVSCWERFSDFPASTQLFAFWLWDFQLKSLVSLRTLRPCLNGGNQKRCTCLWHKVNFSMSSP